MTLPPAQSRSQAVAANYDTPPHEVISLLANLLGQVLGVPAVPRSQVRVHVCLRGAQVR